MYKSESLRINSIYKGRLTIVEYKICSCCTWRQSFEMCIHSSVDGAQNSDNVLLTLLLINYVFLKKNIYELIYIYY